LNSLSEKILPFVLSVLLLVVAFFVFDSHKVSNKRTETKNDYAEIADVKYGLFSVYEWKRKMSVALESKIDEFTLKGNNKKTLKREVESALNVLMKEAEKMVQDEMENAGLLARLFGVAEKMDRRLKEMRQRIPEFADKILVELDKPQNRKQLSGFIEQKMDELLESTVGQENRSFQIALLDKHGCSDVEGCLSLLNVKSEAQNSRLLSRGIIAILLSLLIATMAFIYCEKNNWLLLFPIGTSLLLLGGAVSLPMIDIDARIHEFNLGFLGQSIDFSQQVLFYQSKSILEIIQILITQHGIQTIFVGLLILLFSVLFPLLKLGTSAAAIFNPSILKNRVLCFFALESGKWSMADVMVVAIFMSYIGFQGIIDNQLQGLEESAGSNIDILSTNNSSLELGFFYFFTFCMISLFLSSFLNKVLTKNPY